MDEYIEKKIKTELLEKDFIKWNKDSIIFLVSIFEYKKLNSFYDFNLILLNDYIKWYKNYLNTNNDTKKDTNNDTNNDTKDDKIDMYKLELLTNIYSLIKDDIKNQQNYNYEDILNENTKVNNIPNNNSNLNLFEYFLESFGITNYCNFTIGIIITLLYIIFKYIITFIFYEKKKEEKKNIFELKIPIGDNLINNSLIKFFLGNKDEKFDLSNLSSFLGDKFNL